MPIRTDYLCAAAEEIGCREAKGLSAVNDMSDNSVREHHSHGRVDDKKDLLIFVWFLSTSAKMWQQPQLHGILREFLSLIRQRKATTMPVILNLLLLLHVRLLQ